MLYCMTRSRNSLLQNHARLQPGPSRNGQAAIGVLLERLVAVLKGSSWLQVLQMGLKRVAESWRWRQWASRRISFS